MEGEVMLNNSREYRLHFFENENENISYCLQNNHPHIYNNTKPHFIDSQSVKLALLITFE